MGFEHQSAYHRILERKFDGLREHKVDVVIYCSIMNKNFMVST